MSITMVFIVSITFILSKQKRNVDLIKSMQKQKLCNIEKPSGNTEILEFNQYQKSDKALFIIYADLECLIEQTDNCKNNPEN